MSLAAIAIGRNEGPRLERCLESLSAVQIIIYVDSGSNDGSVEAARTRGAEVVELDMSQPFTAARARNAGLKRLRQIAPNTEFVQLIDGDCEIRGGWLQKAVAFLRDHNGVAIVCGRRRERFPENSLYNAHCNREWATPVGETNACGGDALMRLSALEQVGAYNPNLIAGEEPEMCVRLRARGWKIWRLDAEMTWHDAEITRFTQFWKRARRTGHAYAEGAYLHGRAPFFHNVTECKRALAWGAVLPLAIVLLAFATPWFLFCFGFYALQILRIAWRDGGRREAFVHATLLTIGKFPEALGIVEFGLRRILGQRAKIMEYK